MTAKFNEQDFEFMARALELARLGVYSTAPNPRVGCVLVKQDQIVAEGWHVQAGGPHAEVIALQQLADAQGTTAYVTLEPCSHFGKTPPCADALIAAGVVRVVVAMQDPNPLVAGKGIARLQHAGIKVQVGLLQEQAELLNIGFCQRMRTGLPYVRTKLAMSLDGRTAMANGESKWITGTEARWDVQRLRARSSAILTGVNTVLADDPALNVRDIARNPHFARHLSIGSTIVSPMRVILDSQLQTPINAQMAKLPGRSLILTLCDAQEKIQPLQQAGFEVHTLPGREGRLDLLAVLKFLGQQHINEVLVEAGPTLNGALLEAGLLDAGIVYLAPSIMGDLGRGLFSLPIHAMAQKKSLCWREMRQIGSDIRLTFSLARDV